MSEQNKDMLNDLVIESRDHLSAIEPDLLELEQKGSAVSDELINRVFRAVHSIKGGFGFFGIDPVTRLAHGMENALGLVRDKQLAVTAALVDTLLLGVDKLRALLDDINNASSVSVENELSRLQPFVAAKKEAEQTATGKTPAGISLDTAFGARHPDLGQDRIKAAVGQGKTIYRITLYAHKDIEGKSLTPVSLIDKWEKMGEILDIALDIDAIIGIKGSSRADLAYSVVFASILEPDLVGMGVEVAQDQIHVIDTSSVKGSLLRESKEKLLAKTGRESAQRAAEGGQRPEARIEDAIRVKVSLLNNLMNLAGELVLSRNQLMQGVSRKISETMLSDRVFKEFDHQISELGSTAAQAIAANPSSAPQIMAQQAERIRQLFRRSLAFGMIDMPGARSIVQHIDLVTSMLQENIMQTRLQPVSVVFSKFPRIIRDLAKQLNKEVNLTLIGQDVELDKSVVEALSDPLTHLIRNCVDHGIESQAVRQKAGKRPQGEVVLRAYHEGGKVNIEITDDGAGINTQRVKDIAIDKGLLTPEAAEKLSEQEIHRFIFAPGFSTAEKISDISGRGVGLDVVRTNIERLGGTVEIDTTQGIGTCFSLRLPLTLAIISALIVTAEKKRFALPQVNIEELLRIRAKDITSTIERIGRSEVVRLRGKLLPLVRLADVLGIAPTFADPSTERRLTDRRTRWSDRRGKPEPEEPAEQGDAEAKERRSGKDRRENIANAVKIVVMRCGEHRYGLMVDDVFDSEEIVVKPLSSYLKQTRCYAGCTILGDGIIAMILDTNGIAECAALKFSDLEAENQKQQQLHRVAKSVKLKDILIFTNGGQERFALGLEEIARVEKIPKQKIAAVGTKEYVSYDTYSMPLLRLESYLPVSPAAQDNGDVYVIVPKKLPHPLGILAGSVEDIISAEFEIDKTAVRGRGVLGTAIINKQMTIFVDIPALAQAADPELFAPVPA
jgi:two-component system chemotaxis sensor kinase CheA